jgi:hypothetical protein
MRSVQKALERIRAMDKTNVKNRKDPRITEEEAEENKKHGGSSQFRYDTPFGGGSAHDRAAAKAAKKGRWTTTDEDFKEADAEIKRELGQE